jgi:hypothetical protein
MSNKVFEFLKSPDRLKHLFNFETDALKLIKDMFFLSYGETRQKFMMLFRDM